ncbi:unnamed protein product [Polarella glacialis]|uniref:ribonuclease H n=1 Tax=Polarella glacialis TaxID=89957 RepID=A0A813EPE8_POLGL|nr:unnamed protein product [Polarella glacialis]
MSTVCPFCYSGQQEDHEHLWWVCPAWQDIRSRHPLATSGRSPSWPACFAICGLMPEGFDETQPGTSQPVPVQQIIDLTGEGNDERHITQLGMGGQLQEQWHEGRVVVCTDGASTNNQRAAIRRAGVGAFWGDGHPSNISEPLVGPAQTNQRAELSAVLRVLQVERRAVEIRSDSKYILDGCQLHLPRWRLNSWRSGRRPISNVDLWKQIDRVLSDRGNAMVSFKKVKGHASWRDVRSEKVSEEDKRGNDAADALAVAGARMHAISQERRQAVLRQSLLAQDVQQMMLEVLTARNVQPKAAEQLRREAISVSSSSGSSNSNSHTGGRCSSSSRNPSSSGDSDSSIRTNA